MLERLTRNPRIFILVAVILALIAAALVYLLLNSASPATAPGGTSRTGGVITTTVAPPANRVVALIDVPPYTVLTTAAVINKYFAEAPIPAGSTLPKDAFASMQDFLTYLSTGHPGRYTNAYILANQMVVQSQLADLNGRPAFSTSQIIPTQRVGESVSVLPINAVAGGIQPGDQVDVLLTVPADSLQNFRDPHFQTRPQETQTLLENIPVVAVSGNMYTLVVNHQDAVLLKFVKDAMGGGIELVMRSWLDPTAKGFKTSPVLPQYLTTTAISNTFTLPPAPTVVPTPVVR